MKKNIFGVIAIIAAFCVAVPSHAQLVKFGVKGGLNVTQVSLKGNLKTNIDKDNQTGFFAGVTADVTIPLAGLGADIAVLYDQKKMDAGFGDKPQKLEYINIPLNLKYTFGLSSLASVYVATGPQFAFNIGDKNYVPEIGNVTGTIDEVKEDFQLKKSEFSWNVGAGVTVLKHVRVGYNYNIAIGNTADYSVTLKDVSGLAEKAYNGEFKNNTHQISLTYIF